LFFARDDVKFCRSIFLFIFLAAEAVLAQVYVKWEGEGGVERQLQALREGHGRQGEVALPKGETRGW
jgi:hypothetical protein